MREKLRHEWHQLRDAARTLDKQTVFVLLLAALVVILHMQFGGRGFFRREIAHLFAPEDQPLLSWAWWFGLQGLLGFVIPAACLLVFFRRKPAEIGLGLGDWKLASILAGAYLPLVVIGTWFLSADPAFQAKYPHLQPAAYDWQLFLVYEALFLFYWIGWEYLWRGFVLFGTAPVFGLYAIFVQAMPFAILHFDKPLPEALLSILGGVALGALVWRCRSFWIAVPIHFAQMFILDFWCAARIRTATDGVGFGDLWEMLAKL